MREKGLSGSTLKIIAVITMFIDHTAATILARILYTANQMGKESAIKLTGTGAVGTMLAGLLESGRLYDVSYWMRNIGRIAFPIYCFLLVEGFIHTGNRRKYVLRLGIFALLSEVTFDLAFSGCVLEFKHQNVYFTLFLGMLTMLLYHKLEEQVQMSKGLRPVAELALLLAGMGAAELLRTDYGALGVLCIMVPYFFRNDRKTQTIAGALSFVWWEPPALLAFIPLAFYNGKRGINLKYIFYIFYPAHLLLLYLICCGMGIAGIPAL